MQDAPFFRTLKYSGNAYGCLQYELCLLFSQTALQQQWFYEYGYIKAISFYNFTFLQKGKVFVAWR
jgi:hypothetical protein